MTEIKIQKEEKQGIWTLIIMYYLCWISMFWGGIYGLIGWVSLGLIGLLISKILLKSIKEVKDGHRK